MLKGQLWATSEIELVNQAMKQGFKVIYLGDPISVDPHYKDIFVIGSAFVPDYTALAMQVDGNENGFIQMYTASLNSKASIEMLKLIFACLYKGIGVIFYLPPEASGLNFIQYLLEFIFYNFGIQTQTKSTQFGFNMNYLGKIMELLYLDNLVTAQEFIIYSSVLNEMSLRKLVDELHPMVSNPKDIECIMKWFTNYKDELIKSNMPLINGVQYAGEVSDYGCY